MAHGHVILSHGLESGPDATKVSALAQVAEALGWTHERPDYRDLDARRTTDDLKARVGRLRERAQAVKGPLVLAGSSMGAFISGEIAAEVPVRGLFLMAPPIAMPGWWPTPLQAPASVPLMVVHGWDDELINAQDVIDWCAPRKAELRLVDDSHRLAAHVDYSAQCFADLLKRVAP
jgi:predicted alpha/beta-hydrolase family hydrolase